jgi:DeoR family glycerol-3-phosphate regulon repressor
MFQDLTARQAEIAELVRRSGFETIGHLADHFSVTTQTIRRDVNDLCDRDILRRKHGGVEPRVTQGNLGYSTRRMLNVDAKRAIAGQVAHRVHNAASVAFSIGTTPQTVAEGLINHSGLRIFTNNLNVALIASINPTFETFIAGGHIRNTDLDVVGTSAAEFFASYKVDYGIYGVGGVDGEGTLLDFSGDEVDARESIRANSRTQFLVLDHSKFSRSAHVRGGHITEASVVFCDREPPDEIRRAIARSSAELVLCSPHEAVQ